MPGQLVLLEFLVTVQFTTVSAAAGSIGRNQMPAGLLPLMVQLETMSLPRLQPF
jgi:hypothetical protein